MTGRRQSQPERIFNQILIKTLKLKKGRSYPVTKFHGKLLSRPILGTGDYYANCLWNIGDERAVEVDFCFPKDKIAVEIDGSYHKIPAQIVKDREKDRRFKFNGWLLIRIDEYCICNTLSWMIVDKNRGL